MRADNRSALYLLPPAKIICQDHQAKDRLHKVYLTLPAKAAIPHPAIAAISSEISAL